MAVFAESLIALAGRFPDLIFPLPGFLQLTSAVFQIGDPVAFVRRLSASIERGQSPRRQRTINHLHLLMVMARHWTDPDCPLWLMRENPLVLSLRVAFGIDPEMANQARTIRKRHFPSIAKYPISDGRIMSANSSSGRQHVILTLSPGVAGKTSPDKLIVYGRPAEGR